MSKFSNMKLRYKVGVGVATAAAIVAGGGAAFAYFAGGAGTGTGSVSTPATASRAITPSASGTITDYSGATNPVTVTLDNANPYSVQVAHVSVSINTAAASWTSANCPTDSFSLTGSPAAGPYTVPAKAGSDGTTTVSGYVIAFVDRNEDQTGCIGFSVPLSVTAS